MYSWNLYYKWLCSAEEVGTDEDRAYCYESAGTVLIDSF